jgi:type VI secretion system protein ImpI
VPAGGAKGNIARVPTAFVLNAYPFELSQQRFTGLPIRIGRNPLNDCAVVHRTISSFHARIEDVGGRLCVVDLGSKNGVHVLPPGAELPTRLPANEPVDLAPSGFQFFLGAHIKVQITFEEIRDELEFRGDKSFAGNVLGNRGMLLGGSQPSGQASVQSPLHGSGQPPPLAPLPAHAPLPHGMATPSAAPHGSPHGMPHEPAQPGSIAYRRPSASTQFFTNLGPEALALQGLRELATSLVPGAQLDTTGDIARFITKIHDALDAFLRSSIPLREGYSQFVSQLDLQRNAYRRNAGGSPAYGAVEAAGSPEALAHALLNPNDRSFDAPRALEGIFADLMLHQLALLEGVMRGVRALLEELSPENVAKDAHGGLMGRYKSLWETYVKRFEDVYEERQTFAVIFGPEFTAAYRQYRQRGPDGDAG